jgi:hypothetical protein
LAGLPVPLQGKTPGQQLLKKWNPEAIVFLVDVFSGRNHFDDDVPCYRFDPVEVKRSLGPQLPLYSTVIRVPYPCQENNSFMDNPFPGLSLSQERMCVYEEVHLSQEYEVERVAIKTLEDFHSTTMRRNALHGLRDAGGLYVEMSYYVEGGTAPKCDPITLLSEHHTFVNNLEGKATYRTDVESAWLPGRDDWDKSESVWDKAEALQRSKVLGRQIAKYGSVPLPFDPQVELRFTPKGERSIGHLEDDAFKDDLGSSCSLFVEMGFSVDEEDFNCPFAKSVVPSLLSLWNDTSRQHQKKSFKRFARCG